MSIPVNFFFTSLTTEIINLRIFLMLWIIGETVLLVDYDISSLLIAKFSNCKALAKARLEKYHNPMVAAGWLVGLVYGA
jgi:hypothetical protein